MTFLCSLNCQLTWEFFDEIKQKSNSQSKKKKSWKNNLKIKIYFCEKYAQEKPVYKSFSWKCSDKSAKKVVNGLVKNLSNSI